MQDKEEQEHARLIAAFGARLDDDHPIIGIDDLANAFPDQWVAFRPLVNYGLDLEGRVFATGESRDAVRERIEAIKEREPWFSCIYLFTGPDPSPRDLI